MITSVISSCYFFRCSNQDKGIQGQMKRRRKKKNKSQLMDLVYVYEAKLLQTHKYQVINLCPALVFLIVYTHYIFFFIFRS